MGVIVGVMELAVRSGTIPSAYVPAPTSMLRTLSGQLTSGPFWGAMWDTVYSWALSIGVAAALAIPLGVAIGASERLYAASRVTIEFLRPVPSVALIPAAILILGIGMTSKVVLAAFACFWTILIQSIYGVQDVDPVATDTARSFGFGRSQRLVFVVLPSAVPYIATGLRLGAAVALIVVVTMEIVVGNPGIGLLMVHARQAGNAEVTYALIFAAGLLGWSMNTALGKVESRVLHWHPAHRNVPA